MSNKQNKIYLIYCKSINLYKIGISTNPEKRIKQLQTGSPYELSIITIYDSKYPFKLETTLHNIFSSRKTPENFKYDFELLSGEWFNLSNKDVAGFIDSCKKIEETIDNLKLSGNPFV